MENRNESLWGGRQLNLEETLRACMKQDARVLAEEEPSLEEAEKLRVCHLALKEAFSAADEGTIASLFPDEEDRRQILSEKTLLGIFRTEYDVVTALTTFSCFFLSQEEGESLHSARYMENVKTLHGAVNLAYGKDPKEAKGC